MGRLLLVIDENGQVGVSCGMIDSNDPIRLDETVGFYARHSQSQDQILILGPEGEVDQQKIIDRIKGRK